MTQFLTLRSGNSGPPFVGNQQDDTLLWDVATAKWYTGPGGGGGGAVSAVFGRTGNVVAVTGDYDSDQVDNVSGVTGASVSDALDYLQAHAGAVSSVFSRIGAVVAATNDYTALQVTNDSSVAGTGVKGALNTLLAAIAALVTGVSSFNGRTGAVVPANNDYAATQVSVSATARIIARVAGGAGLAQEVPFGGGFEYDSGTGTFRVASVLPNRTGENVRIDLYPSTAIQFAINNAATVNTDVQLTAGRRYTITASVWVDDGAGGSCLYMKELRIIAHITAGASFIVANIISAAPLEALGYTFVATYTGTVVRFALASTFGSNKVANLAIGYWDMDTP